MAVAVDGGGWKIFDGVVEGGLVEFGFGDVVEAEFLVVDELLGGGGEWRFGWAEDHVSDDDEGFFVG